MMTIHPALVWVVLLIFSQDLLFVAGRFEGVYSSHFETAEDCAVECGYVTGEAEAACKSIEGTTCVSESIFSWLDVFDILGLCQAASGACTFQDSLNIVDQIKCEKDCFEKFPSKYENTQKNINLTRTVLAEGQNQIQGNVDRTRNVLFKGQVDIKSNLKKVAESVASNNKKQTEELLKAQEKLIDNLVEEIRSDITNSFKKLDSENKKNQRNLNITRTLLVEGQTKMQKDVDKTQKVLRKGQADIRNNLKKLAESNEKQTEELLVAQEEVLDTIVDSIQKSELNILDGLYQTRSDMLKGQVDIRRNLKKLVESNKKQTEELLMSHERLLNNMEEEIENIESNILHGLNQVTSDIFNSFQTMNTQNEKNHDEVLKNLNEFSLKSIGLLTSINNSLDILAEDLQYNTHVNIFGDVFDILKTMETRYAKVQHKKETGLIVHDFESDQYAAAVTDPNLGMLIGIGDIMNMLVTGNGKNWAKSKSIYEENPQEFCKQNWFALFSLKLTKSLFHYRNGRRMQGNPLPPTHSEKQYHDEHNEHYFKVCQCNIAEIPTINGKTPICKNPNSNSTFGDVCQVSYKSVGLLQKGNI